MEKKLYDTSELIECYKNRIPVRGYTTILNLIVSKSLRAGPSGDLSIQTGL